MLFSPLLLAKTILEVMLKIKLLSIQNANYEPSKEMLSNANSQQRAKQ